MNNRAENREFHVIYKTTCLITGKWYIGMHSTDNINDGYLGSGSILSRSVKKYGKENHRYEILEYLPTRKLLVLREEEILTKELRTNPLCMNIRSGGTGNYPGKPLLEDTKAKMSIKLKETWAKRKADGYIAPKQSPEVIAKRAASLTGKKRSEAAKENMSKAQREYFDNLSAEDRTRLSENSKEAYNALSEEKKKAIAEKISKAKIGKKRSAESVAASVLGNTGKKRSEETKAKMKASAQARTKTVQIVKQSLSKLWSIQKEDGEIFEIENLKMFCIDNELPIRRMYATLQTGKFIQGFRVMEKQDLVKIKNRTVWA
jgi:hypothetical protein